MKLKSTYIVIALFVSGCQSSDFSLKETAGEIVGGLGAVAEGFRRQLIRERAMENGQTPAEYKHENQL